MPVQFDDIEMTQNTTQNAVPDASIVSHTFIEEGVARPVPAQARQRCRKAVLCIANGIAYAVGGGLGILIILGIERVWTSGDLCISWQGNTTTTTTLPNYSPWIAEDFSQESLMQAIATMYP